MVFQAGPGAEILALILGTDGISFTTDSDGLPGVERSFESFSGAADEAALSRLYGGIHFEFSNQEGLDCGVLLAQYVEANYFRVVPAPRAAAVLGMGLVLAGRRRR